MTEVVNVQNSDSHEGLLEPPSLEPPSLLNTSVTVTSTQPTSQGSSLLVEQLPPSTSPPVDLHPHEPTTTISQLTIPTSQGSSLLVEQLPPNTPPHLHSNEPTTNDHIIKLKKEGIAHFQQNDFQSAIQCFTSAIGWLPTEVSEDLLRVQFLSNRASCHLKQVEISEANMDSLVAITSRAESLKACIQDCTEAIDDLAKKTQDDSIKALELKLLDRCGKAMILLSDKSITPVSHQGSSPLVHEQANAKEVTPVYNVTSIPAAVSQSVKDAVPLNITDLVQPLNKRVASKDVTPVKHPPKRARSNSMIPVYSYTSITHPSSEQANQVPIDALLDKVQPLKKRTKNLTQEPKKHTQPSTTSVTPVNTVTSPSTQPNVSPKPKKPTKDKPWCLIWVCTNGKGRRGNWRKKDLKIIGVYVNKAAAEKAKEELVYKYDNHGYGDILVGDTWEDEIDLVIREAPMMF